VNFFTGPTGIGNTLGRVSTQQFSAPSFTGINYTKASNSFGSSVTSSSGSFSFADFLNLFLFSEKIDLGAVVRALETKGLFQSLAEPNLIAYNNQEASFLAGGEIPVPVVQGTTNAVTVEWKEYGVRLNFKPTIAGDTIRLKVRPEVSTLDYPNGLVLSGFRIPAIRFRNVVFPDPLSPRNATWARSGSSNAFTSTAMCSEPSGLANVLRTLEISKTGMMLK
jgi:pilus assembly protein CpaC